MAKVPAETRRPKRTRQHIIASLSRNFVERYILEKGHTADRRIDDYGYDLFVETYDEGGYVENGEIRVQLKATDRLTDLKRGEALRLDIDARHYELWTKEPMPVFLILYGAAEKRAYWIDVQRYFADPLRKPKKGARSLRIYIPVTNEFTEETVDYMRRRKSEVLTRDWERGGSHG